MHGLKIKSENKMTTAIAKIIRDDGRCSKNLQTDMGKEFYNANVQKLLKKHNINHYSTYFIMKASVIERYIKKRYVEIIYTWKL